MGSKIHCAHILVEKLSVAQDLKTRISKGESFANLAKEYSIDVSKKRGGDLGFFARGAMVSEFEKADFWTRKRKSLRYCKNSVWISYNKKTRLVESNLKR